MDKFEAMDIKWKDGDVVNAPILTDCAIALECNVLSSEQPNGSDNVIFYSSIEAVHCDEKYVKDNGRIDWKNIHLLNNFQLM